MKIALSVAKSICEGIAVTSSSSPEIQEFLEWREGANIPDSTSASPKIRDNIYRFSHNGRSVDIRVGSIHSIKGETHTATLVLETYWKGRKGRHNLELLLPWLDGSQSGRPASGTEQLSRLKLHYVAMTRPTHLLCLAMKQWCVDSNVQDKFRNCGWQIRNI